MKTALLLLALALPASAQTFENYTVTNFPVIHVPTEKIISVPPSTMFKVISLQSGGQDADADVFAEYPQSTNLFFVAGTYQYTVAVNPFVLGPAKIHLQCSGYESEQSAINLLAEFEPVNVAPDLSGLAVQPAGHVASVALETSTNLTAWQPAAPGNYPATNTAAFYRLKFNVN